MVAFCFIKKLIEKNKNIELVQKAKKDLEYSLIQYENNIYDILDKIKKDIEIADVSVLLIWFFIFSNSLIILSFKKSSKFNILSINKLCLFF